MDALESLTAKQRSTLELVAEGRTFKEIAFDQGISQAAAVKRVEVLREKFSCSTKNQLARKYRKLLGNSDQLYKEFIVPGSATGKKFHLVETAPGEEDGARHHEDAPLEFSDVLQSRSDIQWASYSEPRVVPEALDREASGLFRLLVAVGIAIGLGILAMVVLGIANALAEYSVG